jgi:type II secretion system protein G
MAFRKHLSGQKGFTLIELLVVVAILGILATVAFPRIMGAIDNARERKALADLVVIRDALERFYLDYGVFPLHLGYLQSKQYVDPGFTFKNSYEKTYFYAVRLDGNYSGATAAPNPNDLKDYVLGDPGQVPPGTIAECTGSYSIEGRDPKIDPANETATQVYFWGIGQPQGTLPGGTLMESSYTATSLTGSPLLMRATLVFLQTAKPTGDFVRFKGQQ